MIDESLRRRLTNLAARDLRMREDLTTDGSLFDGYHPKMQAVHEENAAELEAIIHERGWPSTEFAGEDGAEAAWLIAQHAIGLPRFQRLCLDALSAVAADGGVPRWQPAYLLDRIRTLEGRPQVYGTQFDWDAEGEMSPLPIEDEAGVDERRTAVGLPPLAVATARQRERSREEPRPHDPAGRRRAMEQWAREVGWR